MIKYHKHPRCIIAYRCRIIAIIRIGCDPKRIANDVTLRIEMWAQFKNKQTNKQTKKTRFWITLIDI